MFSRNRVAWTKLNIRKYNINDKRENLKNAIATSLGRISILRICTHFNLKQYYLVISSPREKLYYLYDADKNGTPKTEIGQYKEIYPLIDNILLHSKAITQNEYDNFVKIL